MQCSWESIEAANLISYDQLVRQMIGALQGRFIEEIADDRDLRKHGH
jgi:hypothetical protein